MTALELISFITQVLFVGLFVVVLRHALRSPSRASFDTLLLFGSIAGIVILVRVAEWIGMDGDPAITALSLVLLNVAPFAMLRLVDDFRGTPRWVQVAGAVAFLGVSALAVAAFARAPELVELVMIGFFLAVGGYAAVAFAVESRRSGGITRRRMTAVALGASLFIAAIVGLFVSALFRPISEPLGLMVQILALAAVVSFFVGFAPPSWIRRAWREPDLRHFLEHSVHLAGVTDDRVAIAELQAAAAAAFGASGASVGLAEPGRNVLRYVTSDGEWAEVADHLYIAGQAFTSGRRLVAMDAREADPDNAEQYEAYGARTVIAAPITTDDRRMGVLTVYAPRAPIFVEDDLWLLELLADQTAVLIEARTLTAHASELRAREEAARLKEEFLSAAAHDLRTPLTVVLGQAELLERRLLRDPAAPVDAAGVARMVREARRLRDLVSALLDAQRLEEGRAVMDLEPTDVCQIVEAVRERHSGQGVGVTVTRPDRPLVGSVDRPRLEQVIENLVENAIKYGSREDSPAIEITESDGQARVAIVDHGVGIPEDERDRIFERFYRASNVQGITDTGLGLGLYICRRIIDEHGGRIWHEATPGGGSTFVITLPLVDDRVPAAAAVPDGQPRANAATDRADALEPAQARTRVGEARADA